MVADDYTPLWKALSDPKRQQIISLLQDRPRTTGDLCSHFDVSRFAVMKHLNVLVETGLVKVKREGRQRWNFLDEGLLQQLQAVQLENNGPFLSFLGEETAAAANAEQTTYTNGSPPAHISLKQSLPVPPTALFAALTSDIGHWWPGTRAAQSETAQVVMETKLNGRFYELFGGDHGGEAYGTLHATITYYDPPHELHLVGPFNLIDSLAYSLVRLRLTADPDRPGHTQLQLDQQLISPATAQQTADYRTCWQDLFSNHLQPYILE
jgi:DNA-binding transcriptional ArsR family regulator